MYQYMRAIVKKRTFIIYYYFIKLIFFSDISESETCISLFLIIPPDHVISRNVAETKY
ncbi:hypothetical protein DDI_0885 [Dickeya dianthicola RNS04.9]|nr:hypothetical protein DDI_0885 [Dickeya dianthicola RNS04.9]